MLLWKKVNTCEKATAQAKAQATTAINLWFCSLLECLDLWCDIKKSQHTKHSWNILGLHGFLTLTVIWMPNQKILQNVNLTYTNTIYQLCSTKRFASCGEEPWDDTHNILMFTKEISLDVNKFKLILFWQQKRSLKSSLKFYYVINNLLHGGICKAIPCSDWLNLSWQVSFISCCVESPALVPQGKVPSFLAT